MDKPRFVVITHGEFLRMIESLNTPTMYRHDGVWYANAAEMRLWRASESTSASEPK